MTTMTQHPTQADSVQAGRETGATDPNLNHRELIRSVRSRIKAVESSVNEQARTIGQQILDLTSQLQALEESAKLLGRVRTDSEALANAGLEADLSELNCEEAEFVHSG